MELSTAAKWHGLKYDDATGRYAYTLGNVQDKGTAQILTVGFAADYGSGLRWGKADRPLFVTSN
jgi:hypothetical protein